MDDDFSTLAEKFEEVFLSDHDIHLRSPFRLLDLPPELWLLVCNFAILRPHPIVVGTQPKLADQAAILRQPAITRTCRLLRHEALSLFYSSTAFEMHHQHRIPCPRNWIVSVGEAARKRMRTLTMYSSCDAKFWMGSFKRAGINVVVNLRERPSSWQPGVMVWEGRMFLTLILYDFRDQCQSLGR